MLWQAASDLSAAIEVQDGQVFLGGGGVLRAYDARSGNLLWIDEGVGGVAALALNGGRIFAVGPGGIVRSFAARTGILLWQKQNEKGPVSALADNGGNIFTTGVVENAAGRIELFVSAYRSSNGEPLWQDEFDAGGREAESRAIVAENGQVYVSGYALGPDTRNLLVRAYQAHNGTIMWEDRLPRGNGTLDSTGFALAAANGGVFVGGYAARDDDLGYWDFLVRAYKARQQ